MGRPAGGRYKTQAGVVVPSVTTITGRFKESGGLLHWAWQQGIDGIDYRETRDSAASAGTIAHEYVDARINKRGEPLFPGATEDAKDRAWRAFESYLAWERQSKLEVLHTETSLVYEGCACGHPEDEHEQRAPFRCGHTADLDPASCRCSRLLPLAFGGTFDAIGRLEGTEDLALLDWKTSNSVYGEMLYQLAGYRVLAKYGSLLNESNRATGVRLGLDLPGGQHLLRFGKVHGDFHHHHWPTGDLLDKAREAFLLMARVYGIDKVVGKAV